MLKQIQLNLFYFYKTSIKSIIYFWLVYIGVIGLLLIITTLSSGEMEFIGFNVIPSFIFTIIFSIFFFKDTFPFVIKYGTNRHSYLISFVLFTIIFAIMMTVLSLITTNLIGFITNFLEVDNFRFIGFHEGFVMPVSIFEVAVFEALLYGTLFFIFNSITVLFFRFGYLIGSICLTPFIGLFFFTSVTEKVIEIGKLFALGHDSYHIGAYFLLYAVFSVIIWLLIRNVSVLDQTK